MNNSNQKNIRLLLIKIISENPIVSLSFVQQLTGKKINYSKNQKVEIIYAYLKRNNFSNDVIDNIIELHPEKPLFDIYYSRKQQKIKSIGIDKKDESKDLNCTACAVFALADGDKSNNYNSSNILNAKNIIGVGVILVAISLIVSIVTSETK